MRSTNGQLPDATVHIRLRIMRDTKGSISSPAAHEIALNAQHKWASSDATVHIRLRIMRGTKGSISSPAAHEIALNAQHKWAASRCHSAHPSAHNARHKGQHLEPSCTRDCA